MKSKLDQYAGTLLELKDAGKTVDELHSWLKGEGVSVARSTVGSFVDRLLRKRSQDEVLDDIIQSSNQAQEVEEKFSKNPAPELETLIKLHRVAILKLRTEGSGNPELLKLADQLTNTVVQTISAQSKAHFKEREVTLAEAKAAEAKKSEQQKALEMCLDEAQPFPEVVEAFKVAFAALKKARK